MNHMNCQEQFQLWSSQILKLKVSVASLSETEPKNLLQHFFLQAAEKELSTELESVKSTCKQIICAAIDTAPTLYGSVRERSALVLQQFLSPHVLQSIHLADIRNIAVFEIYKQCGITTDTYFERYSSPPGNAQQVEQYSNIAHGSAIASAENTKTLTLILLYMQVLKRFFVVYDYVNSDDPDQLPQRHSYTLNWLGAIWAARVEQKSLSDLIWELFLDVWYFEQ